MSEQNFLQRNAEQIEKILELDRTLGERALEAMTPEELTFEHEVLDQPTHWVLTDHLIRGDLTTAQLRAAGVYTLRDVAVLGPLRIGVSQGPRERAMDALEERYPQLYNPNFANRSYIPTAADAAKICCNLSQISHHIIGNYFPIQRPRFSLEDGWILKPSIADLLQEDSYVVEAMRTYQLNEHAFSFDGVKQVLMPALDFAKAFVEARSKLYT